MKRTSTGVYAAVAVLCLALAFALAGTAQGQTFRGDDYGVTTEPGVNNLRALQALADAAYTGREPGREAVMQLPCTNGTGGIGYRGTWYIIPDSLVLQGCGGTVVTRDTTSADSPTGGGKVFYPVRRVTEVLGPDAPVTVLRVMDQSFGVISPNGFVTPTRIALSPAVPFGGPQRHHAFTLRSLVLDGNLDNNIEQLIAIPAAYKKKNLQDRPSYTGLDAGRSENRDFCRDLPELRPQRDGSKKWVFGTEVGTLITVQNVEVDGYAATGFLGDYCNRWTLDTVRLGSAPYNHIAYKADGGGTRDADGNLLRDPFNAGPHANWGGWTDVTVSGANWWDVVSMRSLYITRLTYEDWKPNPFGALRINGSAILNSRNGHIVVHGLAYGADYPIGVFDNQPQGDGFVRYDLGGEPPQDKVVLPPEVSADTGGSDSRPRPGRQRYVRLDACLDRVAEELVDLALCPPR